MVIESGSGPRALRKRARQPGDPLTPAVFHVLLALVDGPRHGYAIMLAAQESAATTRRLGPGTIYGTLERLEQEGWVRETEPDRTRDAASGGPRRRRVFELLPAGRAALGEEARRLDHLAGLVRGKRLLGEGGGS